MSQQFAPVSITEEQMGQVVERFGRGESHRQIAAWLETQGVKVSHATVGRWLKDHRAERADAIRDKVVEALVPHITSDLDYLSKWQGHLDALAESLLGNHSEKNPINPDGLVKVLDQLRKYTELKLKHAGATPESGPKDLGALFAELFEDDRNPQGQGEDLAE